MIKEYFEGIRDSRQAWKTKHNMLEIIVMTICAVVAECEAWHQIEEYCKAKESFFKVKLGLKLENGIPSHDTFSRVFALIDPVELEKRFIMWVRAVSKLNKGEIVSIDGKTLCSSKDDDKKAIRMVSAWANRSKLVLGQIKTAEKSNEITAIPELLKLLEIKDCVITIDAMGCQKDISELITKKEADYVMSLKGNPEILYEEVKVIF
jgi:predicted transposase YbfD/YdcC